ncbi:MAG: lipid asymmetry maintenance ABC transporter permease subunit MlaE [Halothiobacillaceae bacterium]
MSAIARLGALVLAALGHLGRMARFVPRLLSAVPAALARPGILVTEIYAVGVLSLVIILVSGGFVGLVLGLQGFHILSNFGAAESLGVMVALSLVRELGPVVTALLFAGRAGSSITAEIALMKTTEQLSAMEMMAVDPMRRVIAPRFIAAIVAMPLLAALFSVVGIFGGYLVGGIWLGVDEAAYWGQIVLQVDFQDDIVNGVVKSVVFGALAGMIAVFEGYNATPTSLGMSRATTRTVVITSLAILGSDFILTAVMFGG